MLKHTCTSAVTNS